MTALPVPTPTELIWTTRSKHSQVERFSSVPCASKMFGCHLKISKCFTKWKTRITIPILHMMKPKYTVWTEDMKLGRQVLHHTQMLSNLLVARTPGHCVFACHVASALRHCHLNIPHHFTLSPLSCRHQPALPPWLLPHLSLTLLREQHWWGCSYSLQSFQASAPCQHPGSADDLV